jgi:tetratricopeptide (TPR) repeat protein
LTPKRLTRKEIVQEDIIRTSLTQIYEWIVRNSLLLIASVGLLLITVLGSYIWKSYQQNRFAELQIEFAEALKIYHSPSVKNPTDEQSPNPNSYDFKTDQERREKALKSFNTVISNYPNSNLGLFSRYYAARIQHELDQREEAKQKLALIIEEADQVEIRSLARNFLAHVLLLEKDRKQASKILEAILTDNESSFPKESVILRLARNLERDNNASKAVEFYQKLLDDYPDSNHASEARFRIDRLESKESE